ncbi:focadhesin [Aplysia californica]|uniref:Focadhesin n=1 Tax=Aplysia californica TaxID=6500 RepID=A0ABM1VYW2_APLCA|nr:focadhesin [Aplysia californica]
MDDLKKRLAFSSRTIQFQAICRLEQDIAKKRPQIKCVTVSTPEVPELTVLLETLGGGDACLSELAGSVIARLVETDSLELTFAINSVLNLVPSAKSILGVIKTVFDLLTLQALALQAASGDYKCPYNLRSPPHPLISVLVNRPDSWHLIVDKMAALLQDSGDSRVSVKLIRPFVMFFFLEPQQSATYSSARTALRRCLLTVCWRNGAERVALDIVTMLLELLPRFPVDSAEATKFSSEMLEDVAHLLCHKVSQESSSVPCAEWQALAVRLRTYGVEMLTQGAKFQVEASSLALQLVALTETIASVPDCTDSDFLLLGEALAEAPTSSVASILRLARVMVEKSVSSDSYSTSTAGCLCIAALVQPVLEILCLPSGREEMRKSAGRLGRTFVSDVKTEAGLLLNSLQTCLVDFTSLGRLVARSMEQPALSQHVLALGYQTQLISSLYGRLTRVMSETPVRMASSKGQAGGSAAEEDPATRVMGEWLAQMRAILEEADSCSALLSRVVVAILLTSDSDHVTRASLSVITKIAMMDPGQALGLLPALLYRLGQTRRPEAKLALLEALPGLATHKYCVAPILKIIHTLGQSAELKAVSVRLMTLLWRQQDRCFPHLLKAVSEPHVWTDDNRSDEVMLAKASAILDVCKSKPEQHGAEVLAPLSDIFHISSGERNVTSAALALEGLYFLCEAEVIDLKSLWNVLGEKLVHETRPLVMTRICRLLSLSQEISKDSEANEDFQKDALSSLWLYAQSSDVTVQAAAFKALADSNLNPEQICVSHLPRTVTEELHQQVEVVLNQEKAATGAEPVDITVDQMFPKVPGSCYANILKTLSGRSELEGYRAFVHSLVKNEAASLPRGVFFSSLRRQSVAASKGKSIEAIPAFLTQQYDKCKQPGLRPGLAAGLLFCYDPPVEVSRDGRPRKHYVVRHGKTFLHMFSTLLAEVPVQPSEWHRCSLMPQAWSSFMERLFFSLLESRKAEVDLQEKHGHASEDQLLERKATAWLWVRDSIVDAIKIASRGSPAAQANCVLSLSSLSLLLHKFSRDLDGDSLQAANSSSEHMGHSRWTVATTDTILSLMDINHKPKEGLLGLCQQHSSLDRSPASSLCSAMARVAAGQLVPVFIATDADRIPELLGRLSRDLPLGAAPLESPMSAFCNGLALGVMLGRLFEEHFAEMTGTKGMLAVWKSLTALEDVCVSKTAENRPGCILGVGFAMSGLCSDGKTESRVHAVTFVEKLQNAWPEIPVEDNAFQCMCVALASTVAAMCATNSSSGDTGLLLLNKLKEAHSQNPQISGICLALGILTFTLDKLGYGPSLQMKAELLTSWMQDVVKDETPPMEKVSKLSGLLSLIGSEQSLVPIPSSSSLTTPGVADASVKQAVELVCTFVASSSNLGVQAVSAWMLGHLHHSACSVAETKSSVPSSYSYLPESSIVRSLFDFLLEAGREGPEKMPESQVALALHCLRISRPLPPVNWSALVAAFMRFSYAPEVKTNAVLLAVSQVSTSPSAAVFLSSWLTPPLFTSLPVETQAALHSRMADVIKCVSASTLKLYLERSCLPAFTETEDAHLQLSVLRGLCSALSVEDPPESVTMMLYETTGHLYALVPNKINIPLLQALSECLAQVPDDILDSITTADFSDATSQVKGSFVRCYLVATGRQPIALLNFMVDAYFNADYWDLKVGMWLLVHCLWSFVKNKSEFSSTVARQQWLMELLGHTSSVVTGAMPLAESAPPMTQVISIIIGIMSCAIAAVTNTSNKDLGFLGLNPNIFRKTENTQQGNVSSTAPSTGSLSSEDTDLHGMSGEFLQAVIDMSSDMTRFLPSAMEVFTSKPWNVLTTKALGWITSFLQLEHVSEGDKKTLSYALMVLRHSPEFKPATVWTKAMMTLDTL